MKKPLIINVQKCSIHDGPGIRTTIFFKGCPLECKWCHNPESQSFDVDFLYDEEKCTRCGVCVGICKNNAIYKESGRMMRSEKDCLCCGDCLDWCLSNSRELVGKEYEIKDLIKEIEKDNMFYDESGGGVTLSGGEVMTQNMDYLEKIIDACNTKDISVAIDTCGYAPKKNFERIHNKVDLFLYDIKLVDEKKHIEFTGKSNDKIIENLKYLNSVGAKINIRIPLIEGVNVDEKNVEVLRIIELLKFMNICYVNLLPYHDIMVNKYKKMDLEYPGDNLARPDDEKLQEIKELFEKNNFNVKIGG